MKKLLAIITFITIIPTQVFAARLFTGGFETNSNTAQVEWTVTNGSPSIETGTIRSGTYAGEATASSGTPNGWLYEFLTTAAKGPYYVRFAFRYHTLPTVSNFIFALNGGLTFAALQAADPAIQLNSDGTLSLFNNTQVGSNSSPLTADTWYYIEMDYDMTPAGGSQVLDARINGVQFAGSSSLTLNRAVRSFIIASNTFFGTDTTADIFFDDIAFNDNTGSFQNTYPGDGHVIRLFPNAAGDVNTFGTQTGGTAGAANNYTRVDEVTPDGATTFNGSNTLNQEDLYNVTDSGIGASDTVNVVQLNDWHRTNSASAEATYKLEIEKTSGGTILQGTAVTPTATAFKANKNALPNLSQLITYTDPDGSAWTKSTLDSMQIGAKITTGNTNRDDISTVYALVDYVPNATPAVTVLPDMIVLGRIFLQGILKI